MANTTTPVIMMATAQTGPNLGVAYVDSNPTSPTNLDNTIDIPLSIHNDQQYNNNYLRSLHPLSESEADFDSVDYGTGQINVSLEQVRQQSSSAGNLDRNRIVQVQTANAENNANFTPKFCQGNHMASPSSQLEYQLPVTINQSDNEKQTSTQISNEDTITFKHQVSSSTSEFQSYEQVAENQNKSRSKQDLLDQSSESDPDIDDIIYASYNTVTDQNRVQKSQFDTGYQGVNQPLVDDYVEEPSDFNDFNADHDHHEYNDGTSINKSSNSKFGSNESEKLYLNLQEMSPGRKFYSNKCKRKLSIPLPGLNDSEINESGKSNFMSTYDFDDNVDDNGYVKEEESKYQYTDSQFDIVCGEVRAE